MYAMGPNNAGQVGVRMQECGVFLGGVRRKSKGVRSRWKESTAHRREASLVPGKGV